MNAAMWCNSDAASTVRVLVWSIINSRVLFILIIGYSIFLWGAWVVSECNMALGLDRWGNDSFFGCSMGHCCCYDFYVGICPDASLMTSPHPPPVIYSWRAANSKWSEKVLLECLFQGGSDSFCEWTVAIFFSKDKTLLMLCCDCCALFGRMTFTYYFEHRLHPIDIYQYQGNIQRAN